MSSTVPLLRFAPPLQTEVNGVTVSTARLPSRVWLRPPDYRPRWETKVLGEEHGEEWTFTPEDAQRMHDQRVAAVRARTEGVCVCCFRVDGGPLDAGRWCERCVAEAGSPCGPHRPSLTEF